VSVAAPLVVVTVVVVTLALVRPAVAIPPLFSGDTFVGVVASVGF